MLLLLLSNLKEDSPNIKRKFQSASRLIFLHCINVIFRKVCLENEVMNVDGNTYLFFFRIQGARELAG